MYILASVFFERTIHTYLKLEICVVCSEFLAFNENEKSTNLMGMVISKFFLYPNKKRGKKKRRMK